MTNTLTAVVFSLLVTNVHHWDDGAQHSHQMPTGWPEPPYYHDCQHTSRGSDIYEVLSNTVASVEGKELVLESKQVGWFKVSWTNVTTVQTETNSFATNDSFMVDWGFSGGEPEIAHVIRYNSTNTSFTNLMWNYGELTTHTNTDK